MKMKPSVLLAAMLATFGASAQNADHAFQDMGEEAGIRAREARMLTGAPTSFAEYRTSYWQARDRMRRAARGDYIEPRAANRSTRVVAPPPPPPPEEQALEVQEAETFPFEDQ